MQKSEWRRGEEVIVVMECWSQNLLSCAIEVLVAPSIFAFRTPGPTKRPANILILGFL